MPCRDAIFSNIRQKLGVKRSNKQNIDAAYHRLSHHPLRPASVNLIDTFQTELESLEGQVTRIANIQESVAIVLTVLERHKSKNLIMSDTALCHQLKWPKEIQIEHRKAEEQDKVSLSVAYAGIAETGSIVMCSSPQTPTLHNFLVEDHMVILPASRIVAYLENVWGEFDLNAMPRAVNVLTGPSRTGDVEQTIQIGAHGPLRFHVIILEGE